MSRTTPTELGTSADPAKVSIAWILDALPQGALLLDANGRVVLTNRAYRKMLGASEEDTREQAIDTLSGGVWNAPSVRQVLAGATGGESGTAVVDVKAGGELAGPVKVHARPLASPLPATGAAILFLVDPPVEAPGEQNDLAVRAAHELRGSLGAIANWVHLLTNGARDAALLQQGLAAIQRALKSGTHILDELTDIALLRRGRLALRTGLVDLSHIVDTAVDDLRSVADEKGIALGVEREVNSLPVMGDPQRLRQMAHHLLNNAVSCTPAGGAVKVGLHRDAESWVVAVHDNGPGLGPEALASAFDGPTVSDQKRPAPGKLGVGLALVRHLAVLHGGGVEAASEGLGRGACFRLRLPIPALIPSPPVARNRDDTPRPRA